MNTVWRPGVALMNRLRYPRKFALISVLFILPLALVLALLIQEMNMRVVFAQKERVGTQYLRPVRLLFAHALQNGALAHAYLDGGAAFKPSLDEQQRQIDRDMQELAAHDQRFGDELGTTALFDTLQMRWRALKQQAPGDSAASDARHALLIADIRALIAQIGDASNLILDPDLDSFYLMDMELRHIPEAADLLSQALVLGKGVSTRGALTPEERGRLIVLDGLLRSNIAKTSRAIEVVFQVNSAGQLRTRLMPASHRQLRYS